MADDAGFSLDITAEIFDVATKPYATTLLSAVYQAKRRTSSGSIMVALKVIRTDRNLTSKMFRRHLREMRIWCDLKHPNILPLSGIRWDVNHIPAIVSPWCANGDVISYLKGIKHGPEKQAVRLKLVEDIFCGINYLHNHDPIVVHSDLKGKNVLVSDEGVARICDFGFSTVLAEHSTALHVTSDTSVKGTLRWTAPELFKAESNRPTTYSDIWACGCIIIEVISGLVPYHDKTNELAVVIALMQDEAPARPDNITDDLWAIAADCFVTDPTGRLPALACLQRIRLAQHSVLHASTTPLAGSISLEPDITSAICDVADTPADLRSQTRMRSGVWKSHIGLVEVTIKTRTLMTSEPWELQAIHNQLASLRKWYNLRHPNVVPLLGFYRESPAHVPGLVSPRCHNGNLVRFLKAHTRDADISTLRMRLLEDILLGLDFLHTNDPIVTVSEFKGDNILVSEDGRARIYGLNIDQDGNPYMGLRGHSYVRTAFRWLAPELLSPASRGSLDENLTHWQDITLQRANIWACGCLVIEIFDGSIPYGRNSSYYQLIDKISGGIPPPLPTSVPDAVRELARACFARDPATRPVASECLRYLRVVDALRDLEFKKEILGSLSERKLLKALISEDDGRKRLIDFSEGATAGDMSWAITKACLWLRARKRTQTRDPNARQVLKSVANTAPTRA